MKRYLFAVCLALASAVGCSSKTAQQCVPLPDDMKVSAEVPPSEAFHAALLANYPGCKKRNKRYLDYALFSVGVSVLHGIGTQKSPHKAFLWLKAAAEKGHPKAIGLVIEMFEKGIGVPKDLQIAAKYRLLDH